MDTRVHEQENLLSGRASKRLHTDKGASLWSGVDDGSLTSTARRVPLGVKSGFANRQKPHSASTRPRAALSAKAVNTSLPKANGSSSGKLRSYSRSQVCPAQAPGDYAKTTAPQPLGSAVLPFRSTSWSASTQQRPFSSSSRPQGRVYPRFTPPADWGDVPVEPIVKGPPPLEDLPPIGTDFSSVFKPQVASYELQEKVNAQPLAVQEVSLDDCPVDFAADTSVDVTLEFTDVETPTSSPRKELLCTDKLL